MTLLLPADLTVELVDLRDYPMPFFDEIAFNAWAPSNSDVARRFVQSTLRSTAPVGGIGQGLLATGVLSGLHLVAPYGYGATWLIGSYVLVTLAITLGAAYIGPLRKALESAAASGDDAVSNLRTGWAPLAVTYINTHCWAGAIWLMVAKPYA